jgi:DNA-binding SARP family transcriptional activator
MESLEERGLFVRYRDGEYKPYRVVATLWPNAQPAERERDEEPHVAVMSVRMFGRFETSIGGRPIAWIRRRDAQLMKYLLLRPSGAATRAELRSVFWPEADFGLSTQSLRTACSNIRKAIATVVGYERVERYFDARNDVSVNLAQTVLDVRRFSAHAGDGDAELDRGNADQAMAHYLAAERLYVGELLSGEAPEPWYEPRAEMYKALYAGVLQRLADLCADAGDHGRARAYREKLGYLALPGDPPRAAQRDLTMTSAGAGAATLPGAIGLHVLAVP